MTEFILFVEKNHYQKSRNNWDYCDNHLNYMGKIISLAHITYGNISPNINDLNMKVQNIKIKINVEDNIYLCF